MSWIAILLVLVSSVTHAVWNFVGKRDSPSIAFFLAINLVGAMIGIPVILVSSDMIQSLSAQTWIFLSITGFFQMIYFLGLAGAYRKGDMSVAYPLARSSPIIVVTIIGLFLQRGHQISPQCIWGILLVVGGCFLVPMKRFSDLHIKNYFNPTCGFALMAAAGTAGYSIIDDEALRLLRGTAFTNFDLISITLLYCVLDNLITCAWMLVPGMIIKKEKQEFKRIILSAKGSVFGAGLVMFLTYLLVLIAMAFVKNVSYVVGFRQISILIGVMLGIFFLKEKAYKPKLTGSIIVFVGLVLVGTG